MACTRREAPAMAASMRIEPGILFPLPHARLQIWRSFNPPSRFRPELMSASDVDDTRNVRCADEAPFTRHSK